MKNSIRVDFTAHFRFSNSKSFSISNNQLINEDNYEFATAKYHIAKSKHETIVTFTAEGDHSDCVCAIRCFLFNLMKSFKAQNTCDYIEIHQILNEFVTMVNKKVSLQSVHLENSTGHGEVLMKAGLEIAKSNDMRLNDAHRVLEPNDHYGNMFRRCPNCQDFEIPEIASLAKNLRRCPCCGLKLITWE